MGNENQILFSEDIERKALAASISNFNVLCTMVQNLHATDFHYQEHQNIFLLLSEIYKETETISLTLVCQKAKDKNVLDRVGGLQALMKILTHQAYDFELNSYIEILKEKAIKREIVTFCETMADKAKKFEITSSDALEEMRSKIYALESRSNMEETKTAQDIARTGFDGKSYIDDVIKVQNSPDKSSVIGISTGFEELDKIICGLQRGNLILLAARPGMGKTTLALNMWEHITIKENLPSLFIALEMNGADIVEKLISAHCRIPYGRVRDRSITREEFQEIVPFLKEDYLNLINTRSEISLPLLRSIAIREKEKHDIKVLFIDYLGLLKSGNKFHKDRYHEVTEISGALKRLARELNIPVVCLAQLNRRIDERAKATPILSDLKDSGSLEADADIVLFLHREDATQKFDKPGLAKLMVAKNRRGMTGELIFTHEFGISRFVPTIYKPVAKE